MSPVFTTFICVITPSTTFAVAVAILPLLSGPSIIIPKSWLVPSVYPLNECTTEIELTPPAFIVEVAVDDGNENAYAGCCKSKNLKP